MSENNFKNIRKHYWRKELNIDETEEIMFRGINKDYPSLGSMSTYLKIPMLLFDYFGLDY